MNPRLRAVIARALRVPESKIREDTTAGDLKEWDSLGHILVVLAVEREFGVHFKKLGDLASVEAIARKVEES